jgi:LuxR family transcriptional regulator, maltose regulon positive regulatory protein
LPAKTDGVKIAHSSRIVLKPKLRIPAPRPEQLPRPILLELLGDASDRKLTLLSAPAGYGKTTLLAQWHQAQASLPLAWVSLDEQDNDPVRLWRHIVEAVRQVVPEEDFAADVIGGMSVVGQRLVEITIPMLINRLTELPYRVVVVLDDYQLVTEGACHESVAFFVEHVPENIHLVLSSRSDPPLALGRLRARGELNEIRTEQLAFSEEEAATLLNEKMALDIDRDNLRLLMNRTEGWPAAIYLASLSLQKRDDKHAFIEAFRGSSRYIVDLLGEEVLASLPEEIREFLLRTSVLRRMTGPLCDAVTEREDSSQLLRELARSNLFVVPLDDQGEWYRYHNLFSDLLLYELKSSRPDLVPILHGRASVYSERTGYFEGAIRQATVAADYGRVGLLVARYWFAYAVTGHSATVERWLESLPEGQITQDAALVLVKAWICALSGRAEETENLLDLAESIPYEGPLPDGTASVKSGVATIRAIFGFAGVQNMIEAARRAVALELDHTTPQAALVRLGLGISSYCSGDITQARRVLEEGLRLTTADHPVLRIGMQSCLSFVVGDQGHLGRAESLAREVCALVDRFRLRAIPQATWAPIALGRVLAQRGNLAEAQTLLESALSVRRELPGLSPWPTLIGLLALESVSSALGDHARGRAVLAEARAILEPFAGDAGIFPELLERQERRRLRARKPHEGQLDRELTERELDVLRLLPGGLSTRQMAQSLYVAPSTVRTQVKSIYRKLGVSSRKEAVEEAHVRELI